MTTTLGYDVMLAKALEHCYVGMTLHMCVQCSRMCVYMYMYTYADANYAVDCSL